MNYRKHYDSLIERARERNLVGYVERHHVVPKCLGGTEASENIVALTAEEHFVAHQILVKIYPESSGVLYGACVMSADANGVRVNNRLYGWLKKRLARVQSMKFKGRVWSEEQNKSRSDSVRAQWADPIIRASKISSMTGRVWSDESRSARSEKMKGKKPVFINNKGRIVAKEVRARISATLKERRYKLNAERSIAI